LKTAKPMRKINEKVKQNTIALSYITDREMAVTSDVNSKAAVLKFITEYRMSTGKTGNKDSVMINNVSDIITPLINYVRNKSGYA